MFLAEVLAKGEVPRGARDIWKQRSRWAAAAHMYILDPSSVFWRKQPHMSFWQKSLYWIPMVLHWTLIWSEPIMFTMPLMCLVLNICPYGIDPLLWFTHFAKLVTTFLISSYADTLELSRAAIYGQTMARVLFFVNVKAVLNTIMVYTGWKRPGAFKVTIKAGGAPKPAAPAAEEKPAEPAPVTEEVERDNGGPMIPVRVPCWHAVRWSCGVLMHAASFRQLNLLRWLHSGGCVGLYGLRGVRQLWSVAPVANPCPVSTLRAAKYGELQGRQGSVTRVTTALRVLHVCQKWHAFSSWAGGGIC